MGTEATDRRKREQGQENVKRQAPDNRRRKNPGSRQAAEKHRQARQTQQSRRRKSTGRRRQTDGSRTMRYILLAAALIGLVLGAFLGPQLVFRIQDGYLCQDTQTSMRENLDISVMTTSYEPLLGRRLSDFAEGLASGTRYYVASQDFEVTQELYDRLMDSGTGIYQELLYTFLDMGYLPYTITDSFTVEHWKQYVIYSEDYAKGVNFILWYLKLKDAGGIGYELLMDAEYGTLYAIKSLGTVEASVYMQEKIDVAVEKYGYASYWAETWGDKNRWGNGLWGLWYNLSYLFESMDTELRDAIYISVMEEVPYLELVEDKVDYRFLTELVQDGQLCRISEDGKLIRVMLYYKKYPLCLDIKLLEDPQGSRGNQFFNGYTGLVMGLSDVYGLIPEFAEGDS